MIHNVVAETEKKRTGYWNLIRGVRGSGIFCSECNRRLPNMITKPQKEPPERCPNCGSYNVCTWYVKWSFKEI